MSITLVSYPVVNESGKVKNIFAGFDAVEIGFNRKDFDGVTISQGANNQILITLAAIDITNDLNVGEWLYLFAEGATYDYDNSYQILDINFANPDTEITVSGDFVELATGYTNYKQNWFLESKIVNPDNNKIKAYPSLLQTDGNPNGEVNVNVSMLVDSLKNNLLETSQEITSSRESCRLEYREVWRENQTEDFIIIPNVDPITIIFAAENVEIESFVNGFEVPRMWAGYPFFINLIHSKENYPGNRVIIEFDELDINKSDIIIDNELANFQVKDFGLLQVNFSDNIKEINDNTRYITFNANTSVDADYLTGDYSDTDYSTINTP